MTIMYTKLNPVFYPYFSVSAGLDKIGVRISERQRVFWSESK